MINNKNVCDQFIFTFIFWILPGRATIIEARLNPNRENRREYYVHYEESMFYKCCQ